MTCKRNRLLYATMTMIVMILGLCSRKMAYAMPDLLNAYLGDALWALMIFMGFGFVLNKKETRKVALTAISFCYLVETSQLYHASWIDSIRRTTLGGLVLGYGFLWSDLLAYSIGVVAGAIIESLWINGKGRD